MHIKTFSTLSVLLFIFGCGLADPLFDSARRGIDSARHGINCQPIDSINKTSIIRRLAVANGCESIRGTTLVAVSDDVETYKVDCSVEAMEFKCSFYSDIICFLCA